MLTFSLLFAVLVLHQTNAFFLKKLDRDSWQDENERLLTDFSISYPDMSLKLNDEKYMPKEFTVSFNEFGKNFKMKFARKPEPIRTSDIYIIDEMTRKPTKFDLKFQEAFDHYACEDGTGFATLIRNHQKSDMNPFRLMASLYTPEHGKLEIIPVVIEERRAKRSASQETMKFFDSHKNHHAIVKRDTSGKTKTASSATFQKEPLETEHVQVDSNIVRNAIDFLEPIEIEKKEKGQLLQAEIPSALVRPVQFHIELLVCADYQAYEENRKALGVNDQSIVFAYMKLKYLHGVHAISQNYEDSTVNDPDMRLKVYLTKFLFFTKFEDTQAIIPGYIGENIPMSGATLDSFNTYMERLTLPFSYDAAVLLLGRNPSQTNFDYGTLGLAYVEGICTARYMIAAEYSSEYIQQNVGHELLHVLGANHDVGNECASISSYMNLPGGASNVFRISSCSLNSIRRILFNGDSATESSQCLFNIPTDYERFDTNDLTGRLLTIDEQCRQRLGAQAYFCAGRDAEICTDLWCHPRFNTSSCTASGIGATDGTTCGSGKICLREKCVDNPLALKEINFGADLLLQAGEVSTTLAPFIPADTTCTQALDIIRTRKLSQWFYCNRYFPFRSKCRRACARYTILPCVDVAERCGSFSCTAKWPTQTVRDGCPFSCNNCAGIPMRCSNSTSFCRNGGVCVDAPVSTNGYFAFTCTCPPGVTGDLCEVPAISPCNPSPCLNGGVCTPVAASGFICNCPSTFSGLTCSVPV